MIPACALAILMLAGCQRQGPRTYEQAVGDALDEFQELVTVDNYRSLGFDAVDDVKRAQLGRPLKVAYIDLSALRAYAPGGDTSRLLTKTNATVYPVVVNGVVKSSVTIAPADGGFEPARFGEGAIARRLSGYRRAPSEGADMMVQVPALNLVFLGRNSGGKLLLTLVLPDAVDPDAGPRAPVGPQGVSRRPRTVLRAGQETTIDLVAEALAPMAKDHDGLPG
jgi:hypothetical protein